MSASRSAVRVRTGAFALVFGLFLIWFASSRELFADPSTRTFSIAVFAVAWLVAVVLFRLALGTKREKSEG